jgi:tRNA(Ile)-lysidine synthase
LGVTHQQLLKACVFPPAGASVALAVSGGPDSLGLLLLALAAGLRVEVHHVNHHARATSGDDAEYVREACASLGVTCVVHDVVVEPGPNFEARARAERRRALPEGSLTGHTMDDLAETVLLNMMRGAGVDGLSPMVNDPTKPLRDVRRSDLHDFVSASGLSPRHDESNDDMAYRRNRVRQQLLPLLCEVAERDVVPILARQASVLYEERAWLEELARGDLALELEEADCRELRRWPRARLRRWLRVQLFVLDDVDERHPPSAAEVDRAIAVVVGDAVATELSGGRRLARRDQRLSLEGGSTTLDQHG